MRRKSRHPQTPVPQRPPQRPPSPIQPSPNKYTLTYAQAQRQVEVDVAGRTHRLSIYDKLEVVSDGDPVSQEILECNSNKENSQQLQRAPLRSARLKKNQERRNAAAAAAIAAPAPSAPGGNSRGGGGGGGAQTGPALPEPKLRRVEYNLPTVPRRPSSLYRYEEKTEEEQDEEVEYDLDEEDHAWLELVNERRRSEGVGQVSHGVFEFLLDRFEKEAHAESVARGGGGAVAVDEDAVCCVCSDGECYNSNAILFCDSCNMAVHQDCYGVPYIPEGQWLCRHCLHASRQPASCILCPNRGGAVKRTEDGRWGHVVCALWVPEVGFSNSTFLEPIDGVENIPPARWKLTCYLCKQRGAGACIQCHKANCYTAFHASCSQRAGLLMKMETIRERGGDAGFSVKKTAYCGAHSPSGAPRRPLTVYDEIPPRNGVCRRRGGVKRGRGRGRGRSKVKQKKKSRKVETEPEEVTSPLPVPCLSSERLSSILNQVSVQRKRAFVGLVLSYWGLKRQARNGAPLIRRLLSSQQGQKTAQLPRQSEEECQELRQRLKAWHRLRHDLERTRLLLELVHKREKIKREEVRLQQSLLEMQLAPFSLLLRALLDQLQDRDQARIFTQPVDTSEVPDYLGIIQKPMDFSTMRQRVDAQAYPSLDSFEADFNLIVANCLKYNSKDTYFWRAGARLRDQGGAVLRKARRDAQRIGFDVTSGMLLPTPPKIEAPPTFSWEDVDRLLVASQRRHLAPEEQLQQLLERLDQTSAVKASSSRSRRLKLLKKAINEVRSEASLQRVLPSHSSSYSLPQRGRPPGEEGEASGPHGDDEGDKSLPPKLEPSDSLPPPPASERDSEPPTLKPIAPHAPTPSPRRVTFDGKDPPSNAPPHGRLNGHSHFHPLSQDALLLSEGDVSVVATSTLAPPSGTVNRRTAVLFRKSKSTSPRKAPPPGRGGGGGSGGGGGPGGGGGGGSGRVEEGGQDGGGEEAKEECPQLGSSSFLSVVIPRLETLLQGRKRSHSACKTGGAGEEQGEVPVKRLDTGLTNGFLEKEEGEGELVSRRSLEEELVSRSTLEEEDLVSRRSLEEEEDLVSRRSLEPRRRWASESSISFSSSMPGSTSSLLCLPPCGKGKPALVRRSTVDDKSELIACIQNGNFARAARIAAEVGNSSIWMPASAAAVVLEPLKLVWAKCSGYPSYPALIIDPLMPRAGCQHNGVSIPTPPLEVLKVGEQMKQKAEDALFLVLFFDNKRSWQWLPRSKMVPLGVDRTVDKIKLMEGRSSSIRKAVLTAFSRARSHLSVVQDQPDSDLSDVD
ncbi:bromodomain-containing protein 1-like [Hypomesus transpacificus]|uniref:bromodomain-containing protein 1-like n=1 Tax=Hypomesus transpacificus TaxID=137520 RepID=UPI001F087440|nr:bromodomain-containing protein 1-like [Hypomesus transpacificus]